MVRKPTGDTSRVSTDEQNALGGDARGEGSWGKDCGSTAFRKGIKIYADKKNGGQRGTVLGSEAQEKVKEPT